MKLERLKEAAALFNPNGSTTICVEVPHSLIQKMADRHRSGDVKRAAEVIFGEIEYVLDNDVDEWFNY